MNDILKLTEQQRRMVFEQTAVRVHLPVAAVEKDFWVTEILGLVFSLPFADRLVFKGGTSLSKVWGVIRRFSEDIDIAVDRSLFGIEGEVTKKQLKKLRKLSSLFVRETFAKDLMAAVDERGLSSFLDIIPEPDGEGDATYPEPRRIHVVYDSVLPKEADRYLRDEIQLEVGARSLFEPTSSAVVKSFVAETFPQMISGGDTRVVAAVAEKTFLEKVFLLHELFTTEGCVAANRKSRHMYDLHMMLSSGIAETAFAGGKLWESIRRHREVFTSVRGVDYAPGIETRICLTPPEGVAQVWEEDYNQMKASMIYDDVVPSFATIVQSMKQLERRIHCGVGAMD